MKNLGIRNALLCFLLTLSLLVVLVAGTSRDSSGSAVQGTGNGNQLLQCTPTGGKIDISIEDQYPSINRFLSGMDPRNALEHFHIHGWRWHTASLVRESGRLCAMAQRARSLMERGDAMSQSLPQAVDYVVGFNMKGLQRIEGDLMFPWMRERLTNEKIMEPNASQEFATIMTRLESARQQLMDLGQSIIQSASVAVDSKLGTEQRAKAIERVVDDSVALQSCAKAMMYIEDRILVPAIAKIVPESEQHSFNNKVLMNLGLLDSRLHLVAMYEAIEESGDSLEKRIFERAIPSIPQMMIPRWKRKLYEPKAGVLDAEL